MEKFSTIAIYKGEDILIVSRIIAIVDTYDVLTHDRSYRKAISEEEAMKEIKRCSETQFDPKLVDEFIEIINGMLTKAKS